MSLKKAALNAAKKEAEKVIAKEAFKGVIGTTLQNGNKPGLSKTKTKMTLGALVLAIAGLLFEYLT
jgi:hypothetical protein